MSALAHAGHVLALMSGLAAVGLVSLIAVRALRLAGVVQALLAAVVLGCAQMVLAIEVLSLVGAIALVPLLATHIAVAGGLLALGFRPARLPFGPAFRDLVRDLDVPLRALAVAVGLGGAVLLALVLFVPPNNADSMTYHMTRVAVYLQQGSLDAFDTPDLRQTILPANAELLILWQVVLLRHDHTAGLVQWLAWAGGIVAVLGLARQLGFSRRQSAFAGLAFACLPGIVLQASSTQNDLTQAFFVLCAFYFAGDGAGRDRRSSFGFAGIAWGLAVGTKSLAAVFLPGIAAYAGALWWARRKAPWRDAAALALALFLGVVSFGSYMYVQNVRRFGAPSGPAAFSDLVSLPNRAPRAVWSNLGRLGLALLDPSGIVPPTVPTAGRLNALYGAVAKGLRERLAIERSLPAYDFMGIAWHEPPAMRLHEDLTAFGPLYALLGLPVLLAAAVRRRSAPPVRALAWVALGYLLGVAALLRWQPFHMRFLVSLAAVGAPLWAALYARRGGALGGAWNTVLAATSVATLAMTLGFNESKPLIGPAAVWRKDSRLSKMLLPAEAVFNVRLVERLPPGSLGVVAGTVRECVYPLFDEHFARRIRPVLTRADDLQRVELDFDFLLITEDRQQSFVHGPPRATALPWYDRWDLAPLIESLRRPASGWQAVLDAGGPPYLYARGRGDWRHVTSGIDHLPPRPMWADGWVPKASRLPVRLDPSRPELIVSGSTFIEGSVMDVVGPGGEPLVAGARVGPGSFDLLVPLSRLFPGGSSFASIEFRSSQSFNPKRQGLLGDDRELSWHLAGLRLRATREGEPGS